MTNLLQEIETDVEGDWDTLETFADTEWHVFLTNVAPLYSALKTYASTTGRTDLQNLFSDLATGLSAALPAFLASGGNIGAAVSALATTELAKATTDVTQDAKNALYGGIAIVAADLPVIANGTSAATTAAVTASSTTAATSAAS